MKNWKRFLILLLCAGMVLLLFGCGDNAAAKANPGQETEQADDTLQNTDEGETQEGNAPEKAVEETTDNQADNADNLEKDESHSKDDISVYISVIEQAIAEEICLPPSNGMLYDLDNDGVLELIMLHEKTEMEGEEFLGDFTVCSIYGIENGRAVAKMDALHLNTMAGAPHTYVGIVNCDGKTLFLTHWSNTGDGFFLETDTLYDPKTLEKEKVLYRSTERDFFQTPVVETNCYKIDDKECSFEEYSSAIGTIEYVDIINDGDDLMEEYRISGMTLEEMLKYLKSLQGQGEVAEDAQRETNESLKYPISEEDCYVIYKNYIGHELGVGALSFNVKHEGIGEDEAVWFLIDLPGESKEDIVEQYFIVYVNTGVCISGQTSGKAYLFQAEDYYYGGGA